MNYIAFYNQGIQEKEKGNLEKSAEFHLKSLEINPDWDLPEAWHNAGAALLRLQRDKEANPYLIKALEQYQAQIDMEERPAYHSFWKACVYALLKDKENMLESLNTAIKLNTAFAEEALYEEDFKAYEQDEDFLSLIKPIMEILEKLRYRGEALSFSALTDTQARCIECFRLSCEAAGLGNDKMTDMLKSGISISPQSMYEYCENPVYCIRLSLHVDTNLLFLELSHRANRNDVKPFRLYLPENESDVAISSIITNLGHHLPQLNDRNWSDMIKPLSSFCKDLLYEMPDGIKVRLSL